MALSDFSSIPQAMYKLMAGTPGGYLNNDPFNMQAEGLGPNTNNNGYNEANSPGTQQFGNNWSDLLTTLNSLPQNFQQYTQANTPGYSGPLQSNQNANPDLFGLANLGARENMAHPGNGMAFQAEQASPAFNGGIAGLPGNWMNQTMGLINPLGNPNMSATPAGGGYGLAGQQEQASVQGQTPSQMQSAATPFISNYFGLDPNSSQSNNLGGAFATDVNQSNNYNQYHDYLQDAGHDPFTSILGKIAQSGAYFLAGAGPGIAAGVGSGLAAGADAGADAAGSAASVAPTSDTIAGSLQSLLPSIPNSGSSAFSDLNSLAQLGVPGQSVTTPSFIQNLFQGLSGGVGGAGGGLAGSSPSFYSNIPSQLTQGLLNSNTVMPGNSPLNLTNSAQNAIGKR